MKRYLLTDKDRCPPCFALEKEYGEELEDSDINILSLQDEDQLDEASDLLEKTEVDKPGIPALVEESDDGFDVIIGLDGVSDKIEDIKGD